MNSTFISRSMHYFRNFRDRLGNVETEKQLTDLYNEFNEETSKFTKEIDNAICINSIVLDEIMEYMEYHARIQSWLYDTSSHLNIKKEFFDRFGIILSVEQLEDYNLFKIVVSQTSDDRGYACIMILSNNDIAEPMPIKVRVRSSSKCKIDEAFEHLFDKPIDSEFEVTRFYKNNNYPIESNFGSAVFDGVHSVDGLSAFIFNVFILFLKDSMKNEIMYNDMKLDEAFDDFYDIHN